MRAPLGYGRGYGLGYGRGYGSSGHPLGHPLVRPWYGLWAHGTDGYRAGSEPATPKHTYEPASYRRADGRSRPFVEQLIFVVRGQV